jgi:hypothetical protein
MTYQLREGQGVLFKNDKGGISKRRDRRGEINVGGRIYRLSGWLRKDRNGNPWLSLQADPIEKELPTEPAAAKPASDKRDDADIESDIPF